jgi:DNA replication protein DnaC
MEVSIMKLRETVQTNMKELRLNGMLAALLNQLSSRDYDDVDFLARVDDLVTHELQEQRNRKISYLQKQARLRWPHANVADIKYELQPSLKPTKITELASLTWLENNQHVIFLGPTGTGKTFLACALSQQAILEAMPVIFFQYNELILRLMKEDNDGKLVAFRRRLNKVPLLVIDDWGITHLTAVERSLLFGLIEDRDKKGSLLITSQYPIEAWYEAFQDPTIADATLDRIVHQAHTISLKGESIRKTMGMKGGKL